jgi:hypothetical protein
MGKPSPKASRKRSRPRRVFAAAENRQIAALIRKTREEVLRERQEFKAV